MICTKENGELISINFEDVDCIRGNTLRDGSEGATIYMLDGRAVLLRNKFNELFNELLTASGQK